MKASDGTDIAVDLDTPCKNGAVVQVDGTTAYFVEQKPEAVIRIRIPSDPEEAARLGWFLGNQHLAVEVRQGCIWLGHDAPLLAKLRKAGVDAISGSGVFSPDPHSKAHHHH